jgi:hypothetical protein
MGGNEHGDEHGYALLGIADFRFSIADLRSNIVVNLQSQIILYPVWAQRSSLRQALSKA